MPRIKDPDKKPMATVMDGLRLAVEDSRFDSLVARLDAIDTEWRGFAYEGVGIALATSDSFFPRTRRLSTFVQRIHDTYAISAYIGAGMALAMLGKKQPEPFLAKQEQFVSRWMIMNGYGFFRGFFGQKRYIDQKTVIAGLSGYGQRMFDQGLGRAIWFARQGSIETIIATVATFPAARLPDLWNGIGFTCAYAGHPLGRQACETLWEAAGAYRAQLAVAGALAAQRRFGSGLVPTYTEQACDVFCGLSAQEAAHIAQLALNDLPAESVAPQHKSWRERIEATFAPRISDFNQVRAA